MRTAYAHTYSAALEHALTNNLTASVEFSGSKGVKLYSMENQNSMGAGNYYLGDTCSPADGDCTSRLLKYRYSNINLRSQLGMSDYAGLNTRLEVRRIDSLGLSGVGVSLHLVACSGQSQRHVQFLGQPVQPGSPGPGPSGVGEGQRVLRPAAPHRHQRHMGTTHGRVLERGVRRSPAAGASARSSPPTRVSRTRCTTAPTLSVIRPARVAPWRCSPSRSTTSRATRMDRRPASRTRSSTSISPRWRRITTGPIRRSTTATTDRSRLT